MSTVLSDKVTYGIFRWQTNILTFCYNTAVLLRLLASFILVRFSSATW